jgi:hypothetical protein
VPSLPTATYRARVVRTRLQTSYFSVQGGEGRPPRFTKADFTARGGQRPKAAPGGNGLEAQAVRTRGTILLS